MKKGIVKVLSLSAKNKSHIFRSGDEVSENDVENFDELVKQGYIKADKKYFAAVKKAKEAADAATEKLAELSKAEKILRGKLTESKRSVDEKSSIINTKKDELEKATSEFEAAKTDEDKGIAKKKVDLIEAEVEKIEKDGGADLKEALNASEILEKEHATMLEALAEAREDLSKAQKDLAKY